MKRYAAGATIMNNGDVAQHIKFIRKGQVSIFVSNQLINSSSVKKEAQELLFDTLSTVSLPVINCKRDLVFVLTHGYPMKPSNSNDLKQEIIASLNSYRGKTYSQLLGSITRWLTRSIGLVRSFKRKKSTLTSLDSGFLGKRR